MVEDKEAGARRELTSEAVARANVALSELLNNVRAPHKSAAALLLRV